MVEVVQAFFKEGYLLRQLNHTFIRLILKFQGAAKVKHFRPISLCNVCYKIITKIMANRLAPLLGKMISPLQGAFVPGRWIAENVMLAKEVLHFMRHKQGQGSVAGFKVDMMKAYDHIEWGFLLKILEDFGFSNRWRNMITQCITTVKFSVLVNGSLFGFFSSSRGIRQGDPLSPYLFILCNEVLSRMLLQREKEDKLHGILVGRGCPHISHLMFADDLMLFCKPTADEVEVLKECLDTYEQWSGQRKNKEISSIFGSCNASEERVTDLGAIMGVSSTLDVFEYLELTMTIWGRYKGTFDDVVDKIKSRLMGWHAKALS